MTTTAYTIGARPTYDSNLATWSRVRKTGRRLYDNPPYEGGWVWRHAHEAEAFMVASALPFEAKVYGLCLPTGWGVDVTPTPDADGVHRLINDAIVFNLEEA